MGMEISLLFAARIPFYEQLGWRSWPMRRELLRRKAGATPPARGSDLVIERFAPERDLDAVVALHAETAAGLAGVATRDAAAWRASLRLTGNPGEEFLVARAGRDRALLAYARAIRLNEALTIAEHGLCDPDALAALCEALLVPREPDPLAPAEKPSAQFRSFAVLSVAADPALLAALERRGVACSSIEDPTPMLRCLACAGARAAPGSSARAGHILRRRRESDAPARSPRLLVGGSFLRSFAVFLGPLQEHVDLAPGLVVARLLGEGDRVREDPRRLRGIPALEECPAEVAVGGGVVGIDPRGLFEGVDRLAGPAELEQRASEAEPEHGIRGVLLEELAHPRGRASSAVTSTIAMHDRLPELHSPRSTTPRRRKARSDGHFLSCAAHCSNACS